MSEERVSRWPVWSVFDRAPEGRGDWEPRQAAFAAGYLAMSGQIVDATIVAAPKQRNTQAEKAAIKAGRIPDGWASRPAKLRQKDRDARWTVKFSKAKPREDGAPQADLAVPAFGYKNHVSIDRRHRLIRRWTTTDAAAHDSARLGDLIDPENTASELWADTSYRSAKNEALLAGHAGAFDEFVEQFRLKIFQYSWLM